MTVFAHKLIEQCRDGAQLFADSQIIDLGDSEYLEDAIESALKENIRAPFDRVVLFDESVESGDGRHSTAFFWFQVDSNTAAVAFYMLRSGIVHFVFSGSVTLRDSGYFDFFLSKYNTIWEEPYITRLVHFYVPRARALFAIMACSNVTTVDVEAAVSLNKKRIKNGKPPLLNYKTLILDVSPQQKTAGQPIGLHASPRQHLRRGHIRKLDDGRRIWVNSCLVGRPVNGFLNKSYKVLASGPIAK